MIRLHFVVEGASEERFVHGCLGAHLAGHGVFCDARRVATHRRGPRAHRGGVVSHSHVKVDLQSWVRQDRRPEARFTTMIDVYRLPPDFPGVREASMCAGPYEKVAVLERALGAEIGDPRFVPYLQLHEFEALVLVRPTALGTYFPGQEAAIERLTAEVAGFESPELVDDRPNRSPASRIIGHIPLYAGRKAIFGPLTAASIGLPALRARCPHFDSWVATLGRLGHEGAR